MRPARNLPLLFARRAQAAALAWGRAPLLFAPSRALRGLVAPRDVAGWLDCSLLHHPFFSVVCRGKPLRLSQVSSARTCAEQTVPGYLDGAKVLAWMERGATLMLGNLEEWHRPAREFCRAVAERSRWRVGATVFWTAADSFGLRPHYDDAHVFAVQVAGSKRWTLQDPRSGLEKVVELRPGQGLYLPKGLIHGTRALGTASLHVSITFRPEQAAGG